MNEKQWDGTLSGLEQHKGSPAEKVQQARWAEYEIPHDLAQVRQGEKYIKLCEQRIALAKEMVGEEVCKEMEEALEGVRKATERFQLLLNEALDHTPGESDNSDERTLH